MKDKKATFKKNLRKYMDSLGLKSVDVCEALKIQKGTFSHYYNGLTIPNSEMINKLSNYLSCTPKDLLTDAETFISYSSKESGNWLTTLLMAYQDGLLTKEEFMEQKKIYQKNAGD